MISQWMQRELMNVSLSLTLDLMDVHPLSYHFAPLVRRQRVVPAIVGTALLTEVANALGYSHSGYDSPLEYIDSLRHIQGWSTERVLDELRSFQRELAA